MWGLRLLGLGSCSTDVRKNHWGKSPLHGQSLRTGLFEQVRNSVPYIILKGNITGI